MTPRSLDKFYTKQDVIIKLFSESSDIFKHINFQDYECILEPSAGSGNFSNFLTRYGNVIAVDIEPENRDILKKDFLKENIELPGNTIVVGNPPFGKQCSLAVKFFNRAASYHNVSVIAFILPRSFKKLSIQKRLDRYFSLQTTIDLDPDSFLLDGQIYDVPSVFQIWKRTNEQRPKLGKQILLNDGVRFTTKNFCDRTVAIRRIGVNAGRAELFNNQSIESHYFIDSDIDLQEIISYLNRFKWEHNDTTGPRSISKQQFIKLLNNYGSA